MRFGQLEIRTIATLILSRFTLSPPADFRLDDPPDANHQPPRRAARGRLTQAVDPLSRIRLAIAGFC